MSDEAKPADDQPKAEKDYTEENVAMSVSEDKRLVRMGIDPDGDPFEIMRQITARVKYLKENPDAT